MKMVKLGLFVTTFLSSCILVRSVPGAEQNEKTRTYPTALRSALAVSCAFLLSAALQMVLSQQDIPNRTVLACTLISVFVFSLLTEFFATPAHHDVFVPVSAVILLLSLPDGLSAASTSLYCVGTAAGYVIFMTVLSCVFDRVFLSDAPKAVKGLPLLLCALAIAAIAFSGF